MGEHRGMTISHAIPRPLLALCSLAVLSLGGLACATDTVPVAGTEAKTAAALFVPVKALIGDAACDHPSQCRAVGVGAKACGGPSGYLAWSVKNTDQKALLAAVQAHAAAEKAENQASGLISDCQMKPEPTATCRPRPEDGKKTCQLGQGGVRGID
jgi:hypothetical protein